MNIFWIALASVFAGGIALGLQAPINSALSRTIGDSIAATMVSFGVGFLSLTLLVAVRGAFPGMAVLRTIQPWMFAGGMLGAFYVWSALWGVSRLGVVTMTAALILGQLVVAMLIDRAGAFGVPVNAISWQRVVAIVLVGSGLVMSRF
jgi:transporter family-2 protein